MSDLKTCPSCGSNTFLAAVSACSGAPDPRPGELAELRARVERLQVYHADDAPSWRHRAEALEAKTEHERIAMATESEKLRAVLLALQTFPGTDIGYCWCPKGVPLTRWVTESKDPNDWHSSTCKAARAAVGAE